MASFGVDDSPKLHQAHDLATPNNCAVGGLCKIEALRKRSPLRAMWSISSL